MCTRKINYKEILILILTTLPLNVFAGSQKITSSQYGDNWPFSVQKGILVCKQPGAVTFVTNGKSYAVNGLAMSDKRNLNIRPIWKSDIESDHAKFMIKKGRPDLVPKISISPIIDDGLKLCQ